MSGLEIAGIVIGALGTLSGISFAIGNMISRSLKTKASAIKQRAEADTALAYEMKEFRRTNDDVKKLLQALQEATAENASDIEELKMNVANHDEDIKEVKGDIEKIWKHMNKEMKDVRERCDKIHGVVPS